MARTYNLIEINDILDKNDWSSCLCSNEKDGEECEGVDTIQVSLFEDGEHFGEFVGTNDVFEFKLYTA